VVKVVDHSAGEYQPPLQRIAHSFGEPVLVHPILKVAVLVVAGQLLLLLHRRQLPPGAVPAPSPQSPSALAVGVSDAAL